MIMLEDNFADVLGKAMAGSGCGETKAAQMAGLAPEQVRALLRGEFEETDARKLAGSLDLKADALVRLARNLYRPSVPDLANIAQVSTSYGGMMVNAYVLWDPENRGAAIFDTGADAAPLLSIVEREKLEVAGIFLTHSHADHIHALSTLVGALGVDAWSRDDISSARAILRDTVRAARPSSSRGACSRRPSSATRSLPVRSGESAVTTTAARSRQSAAKFCRCRPRRSCAPATGR